MMDMIPNRAHIMSILFILSKKRMLDESAIRPYDISFLAPEKQR
jgi:hypothetical protein